MVMIILDGEFYDNWQIKELAYININKNNKLNHYFINSGYIPYTKNNSYKYNIHHIPRNIGNISIEEALLEIPKNSIIYIQGIEKERYFKRSLPYCTFIQVNAPSLKNLPYPGTQCSLRHSNKFCAVVKCYKILNYLQNESNN